MGVPVVERGGILNLSWGQTDFSDPQINLFGQSQNLGRHQKLREEHTLSLLSWRKLDFALPILNHIKKINLADIPSDLCLNAQLQKPDIFKGILNFKESLLSIPSAFFTDHIFVMKIADSELTCHCKYFHNHVKVKCGENYGFAVTLKANQSPPHPCYQLALANESDQHY